MFHILKKKTFIRELYPYHSEGVLYEEVEKEGDEAVEVLESQIVAYPNNIIIPKTNYRPYYSKSKAPFWIPIAWIYSDWA